MSATPQAISLAPLASKAANPTTERMPIVITGHVDHGKSTIVGRLLAETGSLPDGKLEAVRANCERNAKPFEYAFLLDALKDEQAQGITIDSARVFFKSSRRHYIIIDAPGHIEFLKNMVTGAARAHAALLVIDAREGIRENSRRHGYLLSMLGIRQIAVVVNKMDLVGFDRTVFEGIRDEFAAFLHRLNVEPAAYIPVSGFHGDNIVVHSRSLEWFQGPSVLEALDAFTSQEPVVDLPFRMPVQGVYKFTQQNDDRRIVAGTIDTGRLRVGDEVVFYPSGKKSRVRSIEAFNRPVQEHAIASESTGFTLDEQIYVTRGELAARAGERPPMVGTRLRVNLFWLGRNPLTNRKEYALKLGAARVPARLEEVHRVIDAVELATSETRQQVDRHEVAECTLALSRPLAFDVADDLASTGRFVIVDDYEISGGGIVRSALIDTQSSTRDNVLRRNLNWAAGGVGEERRAERYSQRAALVLVTGERETDRKRFGRELEARMFDDGRFVYFLAIGNLLYGVDADLDRMHENRAEHIRRFSEVANILLGAGLIVIATAIGMTQEEVDRIATAVGNDRVTAVWLGTSVSTNLQPDVVLTEADAAHEGVRRVKDLLQEKGVIYRPW